MDMAEILQGLSYKVYSTTPPIFFAFGLFSIVLGVSTIDDYTKDGGPGTVV